jgi:hypothetical protein
MSATEERLDFDAAYAIAFDENIYFDLIGYRREWRDNPEPHHFFPNFKDTVQEGYPADGCFYCGEPKEKHPAEGKAA